MRRWLNNRVQQMPVLVLACQLQTVYGWLTSSLPAVGAAQSSEAHANLGVGMSASDYVWLAHIFTACLLVLHN